MSAARALKTADGHSAEAEAAANEAAREARAEIIEQAEAPKRADASAKKELTGAQKSAAKDATRAAKADPWHRFIVDVWLTNFNSVEFGFYKRSRNKAKSRQFTTDMDVFAEVIENGERTGLLGYREDVWKSKTGMDKRLVVKLFSDSLTWRATMDMMLGKSFRRRSAPAVCRSPATRSTPTTTTSSSIWSARPTNGR